jgi:hypothetical protein
VNKLISALRSLLALSVVVIGYWTFVWPFMFSDDPDNSLYHYGCITTLLVFLGSIVFLLTFRVFSHRENKD